MTGLAFGPRACALGEGPLWHPERGQLFWFDIINMRLLSRAGDTALEWQIDCHVLAAGWVGRDTLMIASEVDLFVFNIETGTCKTLCPLEADQYSNRSNDGRADPWGGFWIDLKDADRNPDGAVIDTEGCLWNAQWGASRVTRYSPDGRELMHVDMPALQISCPAFGCPDYTTLFATSAAEDTDTPSELQGQTFCTQLDHRGQAEHRVIIQ